MPFTFLPHESTESGPPPPPAPKTLVRVDPAKAAYEIRWPNVVRIEHVFQPRLTVDWSSLPPLELDAAKTVQIAELVPILLCLRAGGRCAPFAAKTVQIAELVPILEGKPDVTEADRIKLERLAQKFLTQRIISSRRRAMSSTR